MKTRPLYRAMFGLTSCLFVVLLVGCEEGPEMATVSGTVYLDDKPLEFGSVMFQPPGGQPARGTIQPDGSFTLSTVDEGDGAVVGKNKVRVTQYSAQKPGSPEASAGGEASLGKLLIPRRYISYENSGIVVDVKPGENTGVEIRLTSDE